MKAPCETPRVRWQALTRTGRIGAVLRERWRGLFMLVSFILIVVLANLLSDQLVEALRLEIRPSNEDIVHRMTMLAAAAYTALIAIPFVPGVEIGFALISMLGPAIVFLVYVCTVAGLLISFCLGRFLSLRWLAGLVEEANLHRVARLLKIIEPMDTEQRLAFFVSRAPSSLIPFLLRHRYVALALVVNLPGNIVIGGGGGIALVAGASRLYSFIGFVVTIMLAVVPVPLSILIFGPKFLPEW